MRPSRRQQSPVLRQKVWTSSKTPSKGHVRERRRTAGEAHATKVLTLCTALVHNGDVARPEWCCHSEAGIVFRRFRPIYLQARANRTEGVFYPFKFILQLASINIDSDGIAQISQTGRPVLSDFCIH